MIRPLSYSSLVLFRLSASVATRDGQALSTTFNVEERSVSGDGNLSLRFESHGIDARKDGNVNVDSREIRVGAIGARDVKEGK